MSNETLNKQLYDKMYAEQEKFRDWLLTQPPEEILNHAYEYTVREDILLSAEMNDFSDRQCAALLKSPDVISDVFKEFEKLETDHMNTVMDCITDRADEALREELLRQRELLETPVYKYPGSYAREHDELPLYRASDKANLACKEAIEGAISAHYSDNCLHPGGVGEVAKRFGFDRVLYVLANTVKYFDCDGRISEGNKRWAKTVPVFENPDATGSDRNCYFIVNSHPGLSDLFVSQARREYLLTQPLSKEDIHYEAAKILGRLQDAREQNSPKSCEASLSGQHFMAEISPDFIHRAKRKDMDRLFDLLPFGSLSFSSLKDKKGLYALINKDENLNQPLREKKPSVLKKLKEASMPIDSSPQASKTKPKEEER